MPAGISWDDLRLPLALLLASVALRVIHDVRYSDSERVLKMIRRDAEGERTAYYRPFDAVFAPLPFLWCWLDIVLLVRVGALIGRWAAWIPVVALVSGRMRALQEIGHNAVHGAMCRSRGWQWFLSNVFFQFPLMKRDMRSRFVTHVKEHHRSPNDPDKDPNLRRVIEGGVRPGISPLEFHLRLLFPLSPRGFWINLRTSAINSTVGNSSAWGVVTRITSVSLAIGVIWLAGGTAGLIGGYAAPLLFIYPLFSWISLLAEHRWFVPSDRDLDRWQMECVNCRPTAFGGLTGWMLRQLVFPLSDAYHLVHSLYPHVRWSYLPALDRHLRQHDERYAAHASEGLLFPGGPAPAALSELRERLAGRRPGDVAAWGERFAVTK